MLHPSASAGIIICAAIAALSVIFYAIRFGIGPMPSSPKVRHAILELARGHDAEGPVYELGAGWGTLAFPLARRLTGRPIVAYEISPLPFLFMKARLRFSSLPNLRIKRQNFLRVSLADASMIVCYLYPGGMRKLCDKLERELADSAVVVSSTFAVPGWKPAKTVELNDLYRTRVYEYRVGSQRGGHSGRDDR